MFSPDRAGTFKLVKNRALTYWTEAGIQKNLSRFFSGMTFRVNEFELPDADLRVDGGGFHTGMPQQLLDVADIRAALKHMRSAGMAQEMATSFGATDPSVSDVATRYLRKHIGIERPSVAAKEKSLLGHIVE